MRNESIENSIVAPAAEAGWLDDIRNGNEDKVLNDLPHINPELHPRIADALVDNHLIPKLVKHLEKFQGLDHLALAKRIVSAGKVIHLAENLGKFKGLDSDIAKSIIAEGLEAYVCQNFSSFHSLSPEVAGKLIRAGWAKYVAENADAFPDLPSDMVEELIGRGAVGSVANNLSRYQNLTAVVAGKLIEAQAVKHVIEHIDRFLVSDRRMIAEMLIMKNYGGYIAENTEKFPGLVDDKLVKLLVEKGCAKNIAWNLEKFPNVDHAWLVEMLFVWHTGYEVAYNLEKFKDLDHVALADRLIDSGDGEGLMENLQKFQGLDRTHIFNRLLAIDPNSSPHGATYFELQSRYEKNAKSIASHPDDFPDFTHAQIAEKIIAAGQGAAVANNLEKFQGLDHVALAEKLMDLKQEYWVVQNMEKFKGLDHIALAEKLLELGPEYRTLFLSSLKKFKNLNLAIAEKIIAVKQGDYVSGRINSFQAKDHFAIAEKLVENGYLMSVAGNFGDFSCLTAAFAELIIKEDKHPDSPSTETRCQTIIDNLNSSQEVDYSNLAYPLADAVPIMFAKNLDKFGELDFVALADKLMKKDNLGIYAVCRYLPKFKGVDHVQIADEAIAAGHARSVAGNLENFKGLDLAKIAETIIEKGKGDEVLNNLAKFVGVNHDDIAEKMIAAGQIDFVALYFEAFSALSKNIAEKLIAAGRSGTVLQYHKKFNGLVLDNDTALLITKGDDRPSWAVFSDHFDKFHNLDIEFAKKLIEFNQINKVAANIKVFRQLDLDMAKLFIKNGMSRGVDDNPDHFNIPADLRNIAEAHHLRISEALVYQEHAPSAPENERIFEILQIHIPEWRDQENIAGPFRGGAAIFGEDKMFEYLDREGLSRHDGLHQFKDIIRLYTDSGLSPKEFYNNILAQVRSDNAEYYSGTAHHHLNDVSRNSFTDVALTREKVAEFSHIEKLQELFSGFTSNADVFSSWKNLKKYDEVQGLLMQKEILTQLADLKKFPEKKKLREYIETLAFHPNIAMDEVLSFWRTPEKFLGAGDSHTPKEVHSQKKPSNYIEFPNLDLSATELRDALVEGDYDDLQSFKPFTIEYSLGKQTRPSEPLAVALNRALGKRSENKKGEAKNAPKLFKELQKLCQENNISLPDILSGQAEVSAENSETLSALLYNEDMGLALPKGKTEAYRAKINKKSDPDAVVAGNDTACCMPFGSGKNNVYTFNPNCSLFTLQKRTNDGKWRTIAQSVLTEDIEINRKIPEIIEEVKKGEKHLNALLTDDILSSEKSLIACDNVEVAESYKNKSDEIKIIYQDFFREYLKQFDESGVHFNDGRVVIGMGYTDALNDLPKAENKFIPRAPVGYSDKLGDYVYDLNLKDDIRAEMGIISKKIARPETPAEITESAYLPQGVEPLTFRDALPVAYIEGKAYAKNESLIEYLHNMENALIAKDVNNAAKKRPNMSLKYIGDDKKMHGYILAYEGKIHKQGNDVVYVSDLASDGNLRAGGSLILGFTESYKRNYIDTGKLTPIYAQMRENTSYPIIKKQLDKLAKGTGIQFQMNEVRTYEQGGDRMYEVMISPVNSKERYN